MHSATRSSHDQEELFMMRANVSCRRLIAGLLAAAATITSGCVLVPTAGYVAPAPVVVRPRPVVVVPVPAYGYYGYGRIR
jgi:hypothetical protein